MIEMSTKKGAMPRKRTCANCGTLIDDGKTNCIIKDAMVEANYQMTDGEVKFKEKDYWCSCWCKMESQR